MAHTFHENHEEYYIIKNNKQLLKFLMSLIAIKLIIFDVWKLLADLIRCFRFLIVKYLQNVLKVFRSLYFLDLRRFKINLTKFV